MGELRMDLYLKTQRWGYHRSNRAQKKRILDEFCETYAYLRKAAARLLRQLPISDKKSKRPGKKKTYEPAVLLEPLKKIWLATDQMCGKRLKQALPLWLPHYHKHHEASLDELSTQLLAMSAATIDHLLKPIKTYMLMKSLFFLISSILVLNSLIIRIQSNIKKKYDNPQTPYQRLMASNCLTRLNLI